MHDHSLCLLQECVVQVSLRSRAAALPPWSHTHGRGQCACVLRHACIQLNSPCAQCSCPVHTLAEQPCRCIMPGVCAHVWQYIAWMVMMSRMPHPGLLSHRKLAVVNTHLTAPAQKRACRCGDAPYQPRQEDRTGEPAHHTSNELHVSTRESTRFMLMQEK